MEEFLKEYLSEASQYVQELEQLLLELEKTPEAEEVRQEALRAAHNLKGISAYMGYDNIAHLAHEMESLLEKGDLREVDPLLHRLDQIQTLLRGLAEGKEGVPEEASPSGDERASRLKALLEELREEDEDLYRAFMELLEEKAGLLETLLEGEEPDPSALPAVREHLEKIKQSARYLNLDELVELLEEFRTQLDRLEKGEESEWRACWEVLKGLLPVREKPPELEEFLSELSQEIEALSLPEEISEAGEKEVVRREHPPESEKREAPEPVERPPERPLEQPPELFLRVDTDTVRRISAAVEELRSLGYRLEEVWNELRPRLSREGRLKLEEILFSFSALMRSLSEEVRGLRMVPVESIRVRVERLFRDLVKTTGKPAELLFEGRDLRVDRMLLQEVWPALVHLLRNAFDHGLEEPEERRAAGKPPEGRVQVVFEMEQAWLRITVADDGRGINWDALEARARERGLSWERVEDLLFVPGLSTKQEADTLSGRGFGLDIVKEKVESLRGYITVDSQPGQGTRISLHFPMATVLNRVITFPCGEDLWAVPLYALREVRRVSPETVSRVGEEWWYHHHEGETVRVLFPDPGVRERRMFYLLIMGGYPVWGLALPEIRGQQEAAIRPFSEDIQKFGPFLGLALLADGRVAFVVDHGSFKGVKEFLEGARVSNT
ncbi:MAG TPA: hypothetical protein ENJ40_04925 [Thermosulfurimonas dismutans]|uniref:histidine kinase n=1 Tax=Thermosulfurimonas dismutans TaxID=999894 RepID=A0A7C3GU25_9BACT|nr:hypothetical protein [Thermosulfurimonas dismutans]